MREVGKKSVLELVRRRFPRISFDDSLRKVFQKFERSDLTCIPVFRNKKFVGEVHELDLLKLVVDPVKVSEKDIVLLGFGVDFGYFAKKAGDITTTHEVTVQSDALVEDASHLMLKEGVGCLPVFVKKKFIGILSERDIIDVIVRRGLHKRWSS